MRPEPRAVAAGQALLARLSKLDPKGRDFDLGTLKRELLDQKVAEADLVGLLSAMKVSNTAAFQDAITLLQSAYPKVNVVAEIMAELLALKFVDDHFWAISPGRDTEIQRRRGTRGGFEYRIGELTNKLAAIIDYSPAAVAKTGLTVEDLFNPSYLL